MTHQHRQQTNIGRHATEQLTQHPAQSELPGSLAEVGYDIVAHLVDPERHAKQIAPKVLVSFRLCTLIDLVRGYAQ